MELTTKQSEKFISWYMDRYAKEGETTLECSTRLIDEGIIAHQGTEEQERKNMVKKILGKQYDELYKMRKWGPETKGEKVFNSLYLSYGPKYIYNFCSHFPIVYHGRDKIIREAFDKVHKLNIDGKAKVGSFKEKYGSFRTEYEELLTDEMRDIFNKLVEDTYNTCAICGRKGEQRNVRGRLAPLCYYHSVLNYLGIIGRKLKMLFSL